MDTLKDLLMKLLDANKEFDTHLQGLCDWYEKNRLPYAPAEEIVEAAAEPPPPPPHGYSPTEEDFKPPVAVCRADPAGGLSEIIYEQAPNQDASPPWGVVNYQ